MRQELMQQALDKLCAHVEKHHLIEEGRQHEFEALLARLIVARTSQTFPTTVILFPGILAVARNQADLDEFLKGERRIQLFGCISFGCMFVALIGFLIYAMFGF